MESQELEKKISQDSFKIFLDINVDMNNNIGYVNTQYKIVPKDLKFMCASLLLYTATRILWLAKSNQEYGVLTLYRDFVAISEDINISQYPSNNKYVNIYCEGTLEKYNFNLDYKGFILGGIFAKNIPELTIYSFFTLFKYIYTELLPIKQNNKFYNKIIKTLEEIADYSLENATQLQIKQICMGNAISLAYEID